jgi:hypothetical protein
MWHIGIVLHRATVVLAATHDSGQAAWAAAWTVRTPPEDAENRITTGRKTLPRVTGSRVSLVEFTRSRARSGVT